MIVRFIVVLCMFFFVHGAYAKDVLLVRGLFGAEVSPMTSIYDGLKKAGHRVVRTEWWRLPAGKFDVAIGHSAGGNVLGLSVPLILTIDPVVTYTSCPAGSKCINWYSPVDKYPFLLCCGGWAVRGADNRVVAGGTPSLLIFSPGHVSLPDRVAKDVIAAVGR